MSTFLRIATGIALWSFLSVCYAIQVDVQSPSAGVYAVGFTVNGTQYGTSGTSFRKSNMPAGAVYHFGVRIGGLIVGAEDIACTTVNGNVSDITLTKSTHATLMYDGNKKCYVETYDIA